MPYSNTEENYLKALYHLSGESGEVSVKELSDKLLIKMPTVNSMMKKLSEKKLVHYESYKPLRLTEIGQQAAMQIIRKHRLTEIFLVEKMGFGWEEVHEIAEQIEHLKAPHFFEKIDEILGYPKIDPHGSPIPDKSGKIDIVAYEKLSDCKVGDRLKLVAVIHTEKEFLSFLNTRKLVLGTIINVLAIEKFDGSMTVSYNESKSETFSAIVSERLLVERCEM